MRFVCADSWGGGIIQTVSRSGRNPLRAKAERIVSQEKTEAIVLRGVDFSESSRIVTFLSPERGRLTCIAKGARRKNSGVSAVLDTFNRETPAPIR